MTVCTAPCPIVFDLDGTLIDSAPDIQVAVNQVLDANGVGALSLSQVRSFIGGGVDILWKKVIEATSLNPDQHERLVVEFMSLYQSATTLTGLFPGVVDALEVLAARGHPLGICTNKPLEPTRAILDHLNISGYFTFIIGGDSLPEKKPDPKPLIAAFVGLGADPRNPDGIYVGDSEYDAKCAASVPVPFMIYTEGYRQTPIADLPHRAAFDDWSKLPDLVAEAVE